MGGKFRRCVVVEVLGGNGGIYVCKGDYGKL